MEPLQSQLPSINPRTLAHQEGLTAVAQRLRTHGYVPSAATLNDLGEALAARLPLLIEGPRGAGKTALPEALARACNLNLFYLQCMDGLGVADILGQWDTTAQTQHVQQALLAGHSLSEAQRATYTQPFFLQGEALAAYTTPTPGGYPNILIIDEIDKLDDRAEDMFLGLLGRGHAHIPRLQPSSVLGLPPAQEPPIVVLTSNNMRSGVSGPLRSRCLYTVITPPTPGEEVTILKTRVPQVGDELLCQTVKALHFLKKMPNISAANKPGLRESIALLEALARKQVTDLTPEVLQQHICYLAKQENDRNSLGATAAAIVRAAHQTTASDAALKAGLTAYYQLSARAGAEVAPGGGPPPAVAGAGTRLNLM